MITKRPDTARQLHGDRTSTLSIPALDRIKQGHMINERHSHTGASLVAIKGLETHFFFTRIPANCAVFSGTNFLLMSGVDSCM